MKTKKVLRRRLKIFRTCLKFFDCHAKKSDERIFTPAAGGRRALGFIPSINRKRDLPPELRSSPGSSAPPSPPAPISPLEPSSRPATPPPAPSLEQPTSTLSFEAGPSIEIPSLPFEQNNEDETDSLSDPFENLPRMPDTSDDDTSDDESNDEDANPTGRNDDPDDENDAEEIPNQPSHLYRQFPIDDLEQRGRRLGGRGFGRAVKGDSYFMQG